MVAALAGIASAASGAAVGGIDGAATGANAGVNEVQSNQFFKEALDEALRAMDAFPGGGAVKFGSKRLLALLYRSADGQINHAGIALAKSLASEEGMVKAILRDSKVIAGPGTKRAVDDAPRLVHQYGGEVSDWAKVTTPAHILSDGTALSIHAYQNVKTGLVVEVKSILDGIPR